MTGSTRTCGCPRTAPASQLYAADGDRDLWLFDLNRPDLPVTRLTVGPGRDAMPVWSPHGDRLYFTD